MPISLTVDAESSSALIAELQALLGDLPGIIQPEAPPRQTESSTVIGGESREEAMERKVSTVWTRASTRVRRVLVAIAELQTAGKDTDVAAVFSHLAGTEDNPPGVAALMAILKRNLKKVDSSPNEPPM